MILSDTAIEQSVHNGDIVITEFNNENLGSNSYDLRLSNHIAMYDTKLLDMRADNKLRRFTIDDNGFVLEPNKLYLCSTIEKAGSKRFVPIIEGKSSVARLGIQVHLTAGFGDVGFIGHWTLEIVVSEPVKIYPNIPICQVYFHTVAGDVNNRYDHKKSAKYSNQGALPVGSKMYLNF